MNLLLDTHALLWALSDVDKLTPQARDAITDGRNRVVVSVVCAWEIAIKSHRGRLRLPDDLPGRIRDLPADILTVSIDHALAVATLPAIHADPFDRLIIAQARAERLTLVTRDAQIARYDVAVLPA